MNNDVLLERTVRPTGQMKTCVDCGAFLPMGYRCQDCWYAIRRRKMKDNGVLFEPGHRRMRRRFTDDEIREIRGTGRSSIKYIKELCQKYNTRPDTIYNILARATYKDVK